MLKNKSGFTLIELLVVVLIIGILAAIAVPQYQKAVEKSRLAEVKLTLKNIADAANRYFLQHGSYHRPGTTTPIDFSDLDIDFAGASGNSYEKKHFKYEIEGISNSGAVFSLKTTYSDNSDFHADFIIYNLVDGVHTGITCVDTRNNNQLCTNFGMKNCSGTGSGGCSSKPF